MVKILVSDALSEEGLKVLKDVKHFEVDVRTGLKPEELKEIIKNYDALIVRSATKVNEEIIQAGKNLKVIGRAGVGLDNVDLSAATERGIVVMNAPAGNTISTCEHTMSMMLALARNIPQANYSTKKCEWKRSKFMGVELYQKTLGIIGLGRIGTEVAKRAFSFGMKISAYDPFLKKEMAEELGIRVVELGELFKTSDFITVHVPLTDETRHMISDKEFALMKKTARVLNCARGGIIDEEALIRAIKEGKIAGAALDVFENEPPPDTELLKLDNVIVSCHLGASTEEAQVNVAIEIAECARDYLLGKGIRNAANYPSIDSEMYKILSPYILLSEKLGSFSCQVIEGRINAVEIKFSGEITKYDTTSLSMAIVKGLLEPVLKETINFVNSVPMAKSRGIDIKETKTSSVEDFVNLISLKISTDKETREFAATLSAKREPRIVKIDGFYVEASPSGYLIVMKNWDKPGIIGSIGTLLGQQKINIAAMTFGRKIPGDVAVSILNVDSPISSELLEKIKKLDNILQAKVIKLDV